MDGEKKSQFIFGINPVLEKLKLAPREVIEVMMVGGKMRPLLHSIEEAAKSRGIRIRYLDSRELARLSGGSKHQRVVAKVAPYSYGLFDDLLQALPPAAQHDWILCVDGLTDPRNFGALLRCAEGAGVRHVVIPNDRSVGITPIVIKSSAGAAYSMNICRVPNLRRAILTLKEKGYWTVGLDVGGAESIYQRVYPEKLVIVLGSESSGIRPLILRECDFRVAIPMRGKIASLNVAVAGGVFLYELVRQKEQG
jgi:23S rRNA (guanosine2251-2'-O)-methyltransferase